MMIDSMASFQIRQSTMQLRNLGYGGKPTNEHTAGA